MGRGWSPTLRNVLLSLALAVLCTKMKSLAGSLAYGVLADAI